MPTSAFAMMARGSAVACGLTSMVPVVTSFGVSFDVAILSAVIFDVVVMVSFFFPVVVVFRALLRGGCLSKAGNSPSLRSWPRMLPTVFWLMPSASAVSLPSNGWPWSMRFLQCARMSSRFDGSAGFAGMPCVRSPALRNALISSGSRPASPDSS